MLKHLDLHFVTPTFPQSVSKETTMTSEQALVLWLRWNDAYEQINQHLYDARHDRDQIAELLTQLDELRNQAISASRAILREAE